MTYKKEIYDYSDETGLETVETSLRRYFMTIANYATQEVWEMDIEDTIKTIRSYLDWIEDCLNDNLKEPVWNTHTGREYTTEALELRRKIISLTEKYYDYINDRNKNNE